MKIQKQSSRMCIKQQNVWYIVRINMCYKVSHAFFHLSHIVSFRYRYCCHLQGPEPDFRECIAARLLLVFPPGLVECLSRHKAEVICLSEPATLLNSLSLRTVCSFPTGAQLFPEVLPKASLVVSTWRAATRSYCQNLESGAFGTWSLPRRFRLWVLRVSCGLLASFAEVWD